MKGNLSIIQHSDKKYKGISSLSIVSLVFKQLRNIMKVYSYNYYNALCTLAAHNAAHKENCSMSWLPELLRES